MRIVVKVGTSTLAHETGKLNIKRTDALCRVLSDIKNAGHEVVLVSSGAIGMGVGKLGLKEKPKDIPTKQAAAAVGQCELMYTYDRIFTEYGHTVAQILLTGSDFLAEDRHENFNNTITRLLSLGALPIINENDSVSFDEIRIGDNDNLSALTAILWNADLLILFSDIDGVFTKNPKENPDAELVEIVPDIKKLRSEITIGTTNSFGTGGMETKLEAAEKVVSYDIPMVLANGASANALVRLVDGSGKGTLFLAENA